jgi:hypothetical protein
VLFAAAAALILILLILVGRNASWVGDLPRLLAASFSALGAVAAVVAAIRGEWIASLILVVLSAWLGRPAVRRRRAAPGAGSDEPMSVTQARAILGVGPSASPDEIQAAYRRLMALAHPDKGGTSGLASQLNAARDRLSGSL